MASSRNRADSRRSPPARSGESALLDPKIRPRNRRRKIGGAYAVRGEITGGSRLSSLPLGLGTADWKACYHQKRVQVGAGKFACLVYGLCGRLSFAPTRRDRPAALGSLVYRADSARLAFRGGATGGGGGVRRFPAAVSALDAALRRAGGRPGGGVCRAGAGGGVHPPVTTHEIRRAHTPGRSDHPAVRRNNP